MQLNSQKRSRWIQGAPDGRALAFLCAGALAIAGGSSTACVATARYSQVEMERDLLAQRNEALQSEVENANRASAALAQEKTALDARLREQEEEARKLQETYDGLVKSLKKELKAGQIEVTQLRDGLRVNVSQDILFDSGSAALDRNGTEVLGRVATELRKSAHQILVIGHTDNRPIGAVLVKRYPSNWELAGARASSVVRLFADSGMPGKRMRAVSVADTEPVASNKTEAGRARNRRIEIRLRPLTSEDKSS